MTQALRVELLHGLPGAGSEAVLRDPTGHDQALLADLGGGATPAEQVTALIAALTLRIGTAERPAPDAARQLTAGDRERLLLAIAARLLGPEPDLVTPCPACGDLAEIPVRLADAIAVRPDAGSGRVAVVAGDGIWTARCRAPTGFDLERAARGGDDAARRIVVDCLMDLADPAGSPVAAAALPVECEPGVAAALAALDPGAECRLAVDCPSCGQRIDALLDAYTLVRGTLADAPRLYRDVYRMARAYHWSEAEILALPLARRQQYLALAAEALP